MLRARGRGGDVAEDGGDGAYLDIGVGQQVEEGNGVVDACIAIDEQRLVVRDNHGATLEAWAQQRRAAGAPAIHLQPLSGRPTLER